jgi:hypothetical protein
MFENKWSNKKFVEIYIWHHTPRRHGGRTLGVAPTVGCTARWSQIPAAVGHDGRNPSAMTQGARSPSAVPHGGRVLAAASKGPSPAAAGPLPHSSEPSVFNPSKYF